MPATRRPERRGDGTASLVVVDVATRRVDENASARQEPHRHGHAGALTMRTAVSVVVVLRRGADRRGAGHAGATARRQPCRRSRASRSRARSTPFPVTDPDGRPVSHCRFSAAWTCRGRSSWTSTATAISICSSRSTRTRSAFFENTGSAKSAAIRLARRPVSEPRHRRVVSLRRSRRRRARRSADGEAGQPRPVLSGTPGRRLRRHS